MQVIYCSHKHQHLIHVYLYIKIEVGDSASYAITLGEFSVNHLAGGGNCMWLEAISVGNPTAAQQWVAV